MDGTYYIDRDRLTDFANVSCCIDSTGIKVDCNYAYDNILGAGDSQNLYSTDRTDDTAWDIALDIASRIHYCYLLPMVITHSPSNKI